MREGRLFRIVYLLLEKGQITIPELAKKLEVSERTIYRDMDALSDAGIPVYVERGRNGGVRMMEDFVLSRLLLSEQEKKELLSALMSLSAAGAYDAALLQKLSALFQVSLEEWYEVDFSRWGEQTQDNEKFELLKQAVIYHRCVRIAYAGTDGEESIRTVWPLKLSYKSRAWYLKAWCAEKKAFRLFKLNRILEWELLQERFTPPAGWGAEIKIGSGKRMATQEAREDGTDGRVPRTKAEELPLVRLRFPREIAYRVFDEFEERQVSAEGGDLIVAAPMPVDDWVVSFLLSFGTQVEVLEPIYLRERLTVKVMELYEKYKEYKK
ncbi:MAG: YafY family transcriptional regulator [Lachnospiraceae bacterium]|nr:YafY family transcriptional regulator [Lachnospiraceae bacterium]